MKRIFWVGLIGMVCTFIFSAGAESLNSLRSEKMASSKTTESSAPAQGDDQISRDPFATEIHEIPVDAGQGPAPVQQALNLQGIAMGSSGKSFVILNGRKYFEGEFRDGVEVLSIQKKEVRVRLNGEEKTLSMALQFEKKTQEDVSELKSKAFVSPAEAAPPVPPASKPASENASSASDFESLMSSS